MPEPVRARRRPGGWLVVATLGAWAAVLLLVPGGTYAGWSDSQVIDGTALGTGTLDLRVDGADAVADLGGLDLSGMLPGSATAHVLTVTNEGTVPADWSLTTTLKADGDGLLAALVATVTGAAATTADASGERCPGTALTGAASGLGGELVASAEQLAPADSTTVCVQLVLPLAAPASLLAATGVLDLAVEADIEDAWTDTVTLAGTQLEAVKPQAPVLSCGASLLGAVTVVWDAVPRATAYRLRDPLLDVTLGVVDAGDPLSWTFTGLAGTVVVEAVYSDPSWTSPPSGSRVFSALNALVGGTCS